jgi:hypothetical protein
VTPDFNFFVLATLTGEHRRGGSHGGTDVGSTTGEAVAFAVLKILRSKHYKVGINFENTLK